MTPTAQLAPADYRRRAIALLCPDRARARQIREVMQEDVRRRGKARTGHVRVVK